MFDSADRLLDEAWLALERGRHGRARSLARRASRDARFAAEAFHLLGAVELDRGDPRSARKLLERARSLGADSADLHYDIGLAEADLGRDRESVEAFLRVLELDAAPGLAVPDFLDEDRLVEAAESALAELPDEILDKLGNVPIIVEERPGPDIVRQGFDPRSLGLFEGMPWSEQGLAGPALCRIVLYRANIAAASRTAAEADEEVRITLLHETAHFFGLDEDQVAALGLG